MAIDCLLRRAYAAANDGRATASRALALLTSRSGGLARRGISGATVRGCSGAGFCLTRSEPPSSHLSPSAVNDTPRTVPPGLSPRSWPGLRSRQREGRIGDAAVSWAVIASPRLLSRLSMSRYEHPWLASIALQAAPIVLTERLRGSLWERISGLGGGPVSSDGFLHPTGARRNLGEESRAGGRGGGGGTCPLPFVV